MTRTGGLGVAAALLLIVVLALGLLYAYRAQTPAIPTVPYTAALGAIQDPSLRSVEIEDGRATLNFADGRRQQSTTPDNGDALVRAVQDHNRADPAHLVELRFASGPAPNPGLPYIYGLLPILIAIVLVLFAASQVARSRAPQRYEALSRLADLRDRGVLTEDEFLREKRRFLK
jgi:hypothetical protein